MDKRNYGIDLFRIVLTFNVCLLHILKQGGLLFSEKLSNNQFLIVWLLQSIAICAVDGYALISGYISSNKNHKYEKIIEMWFQVMFYSLVLTIILHLLGYRLELSLDNILSCILPVTSGTYWYFTSYFGLFFLMPFIDKALEGVDERQAKKYLIVLFFVFVIIGVSYDAYFTDKGKNVFWLLIMYSVGILIKKSKILENISSPKLFILYFLTVFISWSVKYFLGNRKLISNISPTVVIGASILLIIFSRLKPDNKFISFLSSLTFGIYLFQNNKIIWNLLENSMIWLISINNSFLFIIYILGYSLVLFLLGGLIELIRQYLAKLLRIKQFSKLISNRIDNLLD